MVTLHGPRLLQLRLALCDDDVFFFFSHRHSNGSNAGPSNAMLKGSFTNYVDKKRWVGSPNMSILVNVHKVENVNAGGVRWSK